MVWQPLNVPNNLEVVHLLLHLLSVVASTPAGSAAALANHPVAGRSILAVNSWCEGSSVLALTWH
jgi:hypothetical protein